MDIRKLKKIDTTYPLDNPYMRVRKDRYQFPTKIGEFYTLEGPDWVVVCAITLQKEMIFVRQYRHTILQEQLELPAGKMDKEKESPEQTARRELEEETGYTAKKLHYLGEYGTIAGRTNVKGHLFCAQTGEKRYQNLEETEEISVELVPLTTVMKWIQKNNISDRPSLCTILLTKEKHPEWFH